MSGCVYLDSVANRISLRVRPTLAVRSMRSTACNATLILGKSNERRRECGPEQLCFQSFLATLLKLRFLISTVRKFEIGQ
jgi:hypothetical protein